MQRDDDYYLRHFRKYLLYAPKITLPVSLEKLQMPLTPSSTKKLEETTERLLLPSHPARCTSAQYLDRNQVPLLYYFGRRVVRGDDKTVGSLVSARWSCLIHFLES